MIPKEPTIIEQILRSGISLLCGVFSFKKLLHLQTRQTKLKTIFFILCLVTIPLIITYIQQFSVHRIAMLSLVIISVPIFKLYFSTPVSVTITTTVTSYAITIVANFLGSLFSTFLEFTMSWGHELPTIAYTTITGTTQVVLLFLLFRIKRLRHGLPFLSDSKYGDLGVYLSVTTVLTLVLVGYNRQVTIIAPIFMAAIAIWGLMLYFWYRSRIKKEYAEQLDKREKQVLLDEVASLKESITRLHSDNEALAAIIHRDNKIVPALELSVKQFLLNAAENDSREERMATGRELLGQIERISGERQGILTDYENSNKSINKTGIPVLDALLLFMQQKAEAAHITFDVKVRGDVREMLQQALSEQDAATLLADLLENAIIATSCTNQAKYVLAEISGQAGDYYFRVSDSGIPFPQEVLRSWGVQRVTTHKETGGSGIGLMTVYEICNKYHASFSIENTGENDVYRKRVAVYFDGKGKAALNNE